MVSKRVNMPSNADDGARPQARRLLRVTASRAGNPNTPISDTPERSWGTGVQPCEGCRFVRAPVVTVYGRLAQSISTNSMSCEFVLDTLDQCYSIAIRARRAWEWFVPRTRATDGNALYR